MYKVDLEPRVYQEGLGSGFGVRVSGSQIVDSLSCEDPNIDGNFKIGGPARHSIMIIVEVTVIIRDP